MTRLAQLKLDLAAAERLANRAWLVVSDLMTGDPERGGKRLLVKVKKGEFGPTYPAVAANVFRPLGADPTVVIIEGDSVRIHALDDWLQPKTLPVHLQTLKERVRRAVDEAWAVAKNPPKCAKCGELYPCSVIQQSEQYRPDAVAEHTVWVER